MLKKIGIGQGGCINKTIISARNKRWKEKFKTLYGYIVFCLLFLYTLIDFLKNKTFSCLVLNVLRLSIAASCAYYNIVMIDSSCYSFLLFFLSLSLYCLCSHLEVSMLLLLLTLPLLMNFILSLLTFFLLYSLPFLSQHDIDLVSRENKQVIIFFAILLQPFTTKISLN